MIILLEAVCPNMQDLVCVIPTSIALPGTKTAHSPKLSRGITIPILKMEMLSGNERNYICAGGASLELGYYFLLL